MSFLDCIAYRWSYSYYEPFFFFTDVKNELSCMESSELVGYLHVTRTGYMFYFCLLIFFFVVFFFFLMFPSRKKSGLVSGLFQLYSTCLAVDIQYNLGAAASP